MSQQILIVDDEPKIIKLARDYLEKSGYQVLTSGNGREALAIFRQESPAMVGALGCGPEIEQVVQRLAGAIVQVDQVPM